MTRVVHVARLCAAAVVVMAIGGCESKSSRGAVEARTKLAGMPIEDFLLCMGPPAAKKKEGGFDFLIYNSTTSVNTSTYKTQSTRSTRTKASTCTANVVIRDDKVVSINYVGDTGDRINPYHNCFEIVANCMGGYKSDPW